MKTLVIIIFCMIICINNVMSQNVNGKVVNRNQQPVEAVTVVMQSDDKVFVDAVITPAYSLRNNFQRFQRTECRCDNNEGTEL